jgi:hypothetical protein
MDIEPTIEPLITVPEFAKTMLRCSESMGWRLVAEGAFPVVRNGKLVRVQPQRALASYVAKFTLSDRKPVKKAATKKALNTKELNV